MKAHLDSLESAVRKLTARFILIDTTRTLAEEQLARLANEFEVVSSDIRRLKAKIEAMRRGYEEPVQSPLP